MKISINPAVGLKGKAEINYNLGTDKSLYDALKDDEFTTSLALQAYVKADANIFKWKAEWSADLLDLNFFPVTRYLFPSFSNHSLAYANGEISASTNLGRDLLWKQDVGLALYKGDERIEVSEPVKYQLEDDFEKRNPLEKMFEGVPEDKKNEYSVWSYVKWGDFYVKCEQLTPNKKIKKLSKRWVEDGNFIDYSFYYTNDHISNIEIYDGYDLNKWTFKYLDNGHISVDGSNNVGGFSGTLTYSIELNDDGFMQSCIQQNNGGADDSWTIHWWFKYNEEGQLVYVNNSRNESWSFSYQDSNAVSVSGSDDISISYGNLEAEGSWIFLDWMYGIDFENDMGIFGLLGLLGKPSKNLPSSNSGENYPWRFNWSLNDDGYPDFLSATIENDPRTMSFSWE